VQAARRPFETPPSSSTARAWQGSCIIWQTVPRGPKLMRWHYQMYVANFNRLRMAELVDFYTEQSRLERAKPSLIANPLTGEFYATVAYVNGPSVELAAAH
jgi:hypothetical protein